MVAVIQLSSHFDKAIEKELKTVRVITFHVIFIVLQTTTTIKYDRLRHSQHHRIMNAM